VNILAARRMFLSGEMRIQYMHIEMRWYIHNILALFNEKYFFLIIHYIDILLPQVLHSVCYLWIRILYKTFILTRKIV